MRMHAYGIYQPLILNTRVHARSVRARSVCARSVRARGVRALSVCVCVLRYTHVWGGLSALALHHTNA